MKLARARGRRIRSMCPQGNRDLGQIERPRRFLGGSMSDFVEFHWGRSLGIQRKLAMQSESPLPLQHPLMLPDLAIHKLEIGRPL